MKSLALLSNCSIKDGTLTPTYRKPFDLIVEGLHSENGVADATDFEPLQRR